MKGKLRFSLFLFCIFIATGLPRGSFGSESWSTPFDTAAAVADPAAGALSFSDALRLTAAKNPTLKSLAFERLAAQAELEQAGLWSNPELELEFEEFGWDAPGWGESEMTLAIAQEFEFFGQRGARKGLARAEIDATDWQARVTAFDLYLEVKGRFYELAHAQRRLELSRASVQLAEEVVTSIGFRTEKGAALQSDLLLAQLEGQRARLTLDEAQQQVAVAAAALAVLWGGEVSDLAVNAEEEPDFGALLRQVASFEQSLDSTREVARLHRSSDIVRAEQVLAAAEGRPTVTLSGGVKRLEEPNANSFLLGVSLPLPLFNRNQGTRDKLDARLRSLDFQIDRERLQSAAGIGSQTSLLRQLVRRHDALDSLLLPTAQDAFEQLRQAYEAGRLPYTQLLEARRILYELTLEHNDLLLAIHEQTISLESLAGVPLRIDKEN